MGVVLNLSRFYRLLCSETSASTWSMACSSPLHVWTAKESLALLYLVLILVPQLEGEKSGHSVHISDSDLASERAWHVNKKYVFLSLA